MTEPRESAAALIEAYLRGEAAGHRQLDGWIAAVVRRRAWGLDETPDDLVQEVHLRLVRRLEHQEFRADSSLKTFVQAIAKHVCIDAIRKRRRWQTTPLIEEQFPHSNDDPGQTLERREQARLCFQVLQRLSEACRHLFRLILEEERTYEGVAADLGVPIGTVKSRLARCRDQAVAARKQLTNRSTGDRRTALPGTREPKP